MKTPGSLTRDQRGVLHLHEIRSEVVYERAEGEAVPPGGGHVLHPDAGVAVGHPLAPQLQRLHASLLTHRYRLLLQHT